MFCKISYFHSVNEDVVSNSDSEGNMYTFKDSSLGHRYTC
jgi:hypothetical protein